MTTARTTNPLQRHQQEKHQNISNVLNLMKWTETFCRENKSVLFGLPTFKMAHEHRALLLWHVGELWKHSDCNNCTNGSKLYIYPPHKLRLVDFTQASHEFFQIAPETLKRPRGTWLFSPDCQSHVLLSGCSDSCRRQGLTPAARPFFLFPQLCQNFIFFTFIQCKLLVL